MKPHSTSLISFVPPTLATVFIWCKKGQPRLERLPAGDVVCGEIIRQKDLQAEFCRVWSILQTPPNFSVGSLNALFPQQNRSSAIPKQI